MGEGMASGMLPELAMKLLEKDGAVRFEVHAKPRAKKSRIVGERGSSVEIALAAPPHEGAANDELLKLLALVLEVRRRDVQLVRGEASRDKLVAAFGLSIQDVESRLRAAFDR